MFNFETPPTPRSGLPSDCAELKSQLSIPSQPQHPPPPLHDGNYTVLVTGFSLQIYCHEMNSPHPRSYLNVPLTSNYAEFYPKRLAYPYSCPYEGRRNDSCQCTDDGHVAQGKTRFSKVRVDLQNMKINRELLPPRTTLTTHPFQPTTSPSPPPTTATLCPSALQGTATA